jgi:hypothetical protein
MKLPQHFTRIVQAIHPTKKEGYYGEMSDGLTYLIIIILILSVISNTYVILKLYDPSISLDTMVHVLIASSLASIFFSLAPLSPHVYLILSILGLYYVKSKKL